MYLNVRTKVLYLTLGMALVSLSSCPPKPMEPPPCRDESCKPPISDPPEPKPRDI